MIEKFLNPDETILQALQDLNIYFQVQNPIDLEVFTKFKETGVFAGTIGDFMVKSAHEYLDVQFGKPWQHLAEALFYMKNIDKSIKIPQTFPPDHLHEWIGYVEKGVLAERAVREWLKDLHLSHDMVEPMFDKRFDWHTFEIGTCPAYDGPVAVMDEIMDIDDPQAFVNFLKVQNKSNALFLAVQRKKKFWWRGGFYFFIVLGGKIYSVDNMERRLDQFNTAGMRAPDRFIEHNWVFNFLPYNLLVPEDEFTEEFKATPEYQKRREALAVVDGRAVRPVDKVSNHGSSFLAAIECFILRALYEIKKQEPKVGISSTSQLLLTEGPGHIDPPTDNYLVGIYKPDTTALILQTDRLAQIIDTPEWHKDVVKYVLEKSYADMVQDAVIQDYEQNWEKTMAEIQVFFDSFTPRKKYFMEKAFLNNEYTMFSPHGERSLLSDDEWTKRGILMINNQAWHGSDALSLFGSVRGAFFHKSKKPKCVFCGKNPAVRVATFIFYDYHQIMEFFEVEESALPKNMVLHLHMKNEGYKGNSILSDVDPLKRVRSPWFCIEWDFKRFLEKRAEERSRKDRENEVTNSDLIGDFTWDKKHLNTFFCICGVCMNTIGHNLGDKSDVVDRVKKGEVIRPEIRAW